MFLESKKINQFLAIKNIPMKILKDMHIDELCSILSAKLFTEFIEWADNQFEIEMRQIPLEVIEHLPFLSRPERPQIELDEPKHTNYEKLLKNALKFGNSNLIEFYEKKIKEDKNA